MARKKPSKRRGASGKKAMRSLINDAVVDPRVRSALYKNPRATAKRYGLTVAEGKALQTVKKSLLSALTRQQTQALNALLMARSTDTYGPHPTCTPTTQGCEPVITGCRPGED